MDDQKRDMNEEMQAAAADLIAKFESMGFMLVVFPFGTPGQCNYISNARPQDMAPILRSAAFNIEAATIAAPAKPTNIIPLNGN